MSFTAHMIASLKHNKRERVSAFKKIKNLKKGKNSSVFFTKKATPSQLKKIRERILLENKKKRQQSLFIFITILVIFIYVIGFVKF